MSSFVSDSSKQQCFRTQKTFLSCSPINIAVWQQDRLSWAYPSPATYTERSSPMLTINAINSTQEYEIIRIQLSNRTSYKKKVKILVQYRNDYSRNETVFYSPSEKAIICCSELGITMVGGHIEGTEMSQYNIKPYSEQHIDEMTKHLKQGCLPLSWIAKGDICSTFLLERELHPNDEVNGVVWTFHSSSIDTIREMKNSTLSSFM